MRLPRLLFQFGLEGHAIAYRTIANAFSQVSLLHQTSTIFVSGLDTMASEPLLDYSTTQNLLRPSEQDFLQAEDYKHSWLAKPSLNRDGQLVNPYIEHHGIYKDLEGKPLLRVWDTCSGSIPDHSSGRMQARLSRGVLATREARKTSLATHIDLRTWINTPYISFTSSPRAASELVHDRICFTRRGDQNLVAIDPGYRLQRGLPILDMAKEAERYGVKNPYTRDFFSDHYLCLWEVTPAEVVGTWPWNKLREADNWYENIVMPAFKERRAARQRAVQAATRDVDTVASVLARLSIGSESMQQVLDR